MQNANMQIATVTFFVLVIIASLLISGFTTSGSLFSYPFFRLQLLTRQSGENGVIRFKGQQGRRGLKAGFRICPWTFYQKRLPCRSGGVPSWFAAEI